MRLAPVFFWTDSQIVLGYIHNVTRRFHTFVENRVSYIRSNTDPADWHHVDSVLNPADLLTRPRAIDRQGAIDFWRYGPKFLCSFAKFWNKSVELHSVAKDDPEVKVLNSQTEVMKVRIQSPFNALIWYAMPLMFCPGLTGFIAITVHGVKS